MSFRDIFGHEQQIAQLQAALVQKRIPHAFLFHGLEGMGKRSLALVFARALNCRTASDDACDACDSCRKADHQRHLDIIMIKPEGQFIKIEAVRNLRAQLKFKPWEGGKRVCIMDDAEKMNEPSANALLKTLEEPPADNIFILVTARPYQLPATILSRCQQIRFNPLPEDTVASYLHHRTSTDWQTARLLAASSGGSIARALEMQNSSYLRARQEIMEVMAEERMQDAWTRLTHLSRFGQDREDAVERLGILRGCFHDVLVYRETGEGGNLRNRDSLEVISSMAKRLSTDGILNNIRHIERARQALERHADKTLTLEVMMFRLMW